MPQCGIGDFGSRSAARWNDRTASSWLNPKTNAKPSSKARCASGLDVSMGWWCIPNPDGVGGDEAGDDAGREHPETAARLKTMTRTLRDRMQHLWRRHSRMLDKGTC